MIAKLFGKDAEVKTNKELREYIKKEIVSQKEENELVQAIETYINDIRKSGINVIIPKSMIDQEFKVRMANLKQRFGSEEKVKEYFTQL
jgi:FKBP-type peptidyl-prolyl cis-trans isomerase (trigger factor)